MQEHERELAEADARRARRERRWGRIGYCLAAAGVLALFSEFVLPVDRRITIGIAVALWAVAAPFLIAADWRRRVGGGGHLGANSSGGLLGLVSAFFR
ncbi:MULTISPECIES: hypothetical protein [unclassified Blastococcus]